MHRSGTARGDRGDSVIKTERYLLLVFVKASWMEMVVGRVAGTFVFEYCVVVWKQFHRSYDGGAARRHFAVVRPRRNVGKYWRKWRLRFIEVSVLIYVDNMILLWVVDHVHMTICGWLGSLSAPPWMKVLRSSLSNRCAVEGLLIWQHGLQNNSQAKDICNFITEGHQRVRRWQIHSSHPPKTSQFHVPFAAICHKQMINRSSPPIKLITQLPRLVQLTAVWMTTKSLILQLTNHRITSPFCPEESRRPKQPRRRWSKLKFLNPYHLTKLLTFKKQERPITWVDRQEATARARK